MPLVIASMLASLMNSGPTLRAADFHDAVGINIHIEYTDGGYRDLAQVYAALRYVGVNTVRDAAPNPSNQGQAGYLALAKAGVRFDLFINGEAIAPAIGRLVDLNRNAPGSIISIEGLNEVNNLGRFKYAGLDNPHEAATAYQAELDQQVKASPQLKHIPTATFTDYPVTAGKADLGNFHSYPKGGGPAEPQLMSDLTAARQSTPGRSLIATEFGSPTFGSGDGVSELAQARLLIASLLDLASSGVVHSYIYQLLDAYPDPGGQDAGRHYGLFDVHYTPKPSARALRRLMSILDDSSSTAHTFQPVSPDLVWTYDGNDLRRLVMTKSDGEVLVAVWREVSVFDPASRKDRTVAPLIVGLNVRGGHGAIRVIDLIEHAEVLAQPSPGPIDLAVGANALLVRIASGPLGRQGSGDDPSPSKK